VTAIRKFPVFIALLVGGITGLASAAGAAETTDSAGAKAQQLVRGFLRTADRYSAHFSQQLFDEDGVLIEESNGELWLERPGRFRWHYEPPMERLLISDGVKIWLYDVDLDQATVRRAEGAIEHTPAGLLVSGEEALDDYQLRLIEQGIEPKTGEQSHNYAAVEMIPNERQRDFQRIELGLRDNTLVRLTLDDRFGQKTIIYFTDIVLNPALDPTIFDFDVPEGVDLIDQTGR
jgi:outer membrane lipoprotein carrier protein